MNKHVCSGQAAISGGRQQSEEQFVINIPVQVTTRIFSLGNTTKRAFCFSGMNPMQQQHWANGFDISLEQHPNGVFFCVCFFSGCLQCLQQVLAVQASVLLPSPLDTMVTIGCAISEEKQNTNMVASIFIITKLSKKEEKGD